MRVENSISIKILLKKIELSDSNILKVLRVARAAGIKRLETRNLILEKQNQELRKENLKYVIRQGELINYANELSVSDKHQK